jgi:Flp pilus assembly protein TadG
MTMMTIANHFRNDRRGAAAVEFAIVAWCFLLLLLGIVAFGTLFTIYGGVQQLAAEAARASIAGLSDTERDQLARSYITGKIASYSYLDQRRVTVSTVSGGSPATTFTVSIDYDLSASAITPFATLFHLPTSLHRASSIQWGGY